MILRSKHNIIFFFTIFCILFFVPRIVVFAQIAPRTVNYYLSWTIPHEDAQKLADWDMLILDMEQQVKNPDLLKQLRQKNPDIILLAYITPQEILKNARDRKSTRLNSSHT